MTASLSDFGSRVVVRAGVFLILSTLSFPWMATATTKTWTGGGGVDHNWSTASNWNPSGAPQNGDALEFPGGAFETTSVNNIANLQIHSILFRGTGGGYSISGNLIRLESNITATHTGNRNRVRCYVEFVSGGGYFATGNTGELEVNGDVILSNNGQLTLNCITADITVSGAILGDGAVIKFGDKSLTLSGNYPNDFSGRLTIRTGTNFLAKAAGVTAVPGPLILGEYNELNWAAVVLQSPHQIANTATNTINYGVIDLNGWDEALGPIEFNYGAVRSGTATLELLGSVSQTNSTQGACVFSGTLYLPQTIPFQIDNQWGVALAADVYGPGGIIQNGTGVLQLGGNNSFSGAVTLNGGELWIVNPLALGTAPVVTVNGSSVLTLGYPEISPTGLKVLNKSITFNSPNAFLECGGGDWAVSGSISLNFAGQLHCNAAVASQGSGGQLRLYGSIQGPGGMWFGGNVIELAGNNTFTGPTDIACGVLLANTGSGRTFSDSSQIGGHYVRPLYLSSILQTNPTTELRWLSAQFSAHSMVTLHTNAFVNLNGLDRQFTSLTFNGGRIVTGDGKLYVNHVTVNPTNVPARIEGNVSLASSPTVTFDVGEGTALPDLIIAGTISDDWGISGLAKQGAGEMLLSGGNTFRGASQIQSGLLHIQHAAALGTTAGGTSVADGATLVVESVPLLAEPLNIRGVGRNGYDGAINLLPSSGVAANIVLAGPTAVRVDNMFGVLSGVISGTGSFTKFGAGTLQLGGGSGTANTFNGDTIVNEGALVLFKPPFVQAVPGNLVVGAGGQGLNVPTSIARHFNPDQVWGAITVNRGGLLDLFGFDESPGDVRLNGGGNIQTGTGTLTLGPGVNLFVDPGNNGSSSISGRLHVADGCNLSVGPRLQPVFNAAPELTISAILSDTLSSQTIYKTGSGEMRLSGANTFRANFIASAGRTTVAHNSALGLSSLQRGQSATYVNGDASLALDGGVALGDVLTLDSSNALVLISLSGSNAWTGPITLAQTATMSVALPTAFLQIISAVGGSGGLTKVGPGLLQFWGDSANSYSGPTVVGQGSIQARRAGQIAIPGDAVIGTDATNMTTAKILVERDQQFARTANVTIRRSGMLHLYSLAGAPLPNPTLRSIQGRGQVQLVGSGIVLTLSNDLSFEFAGAIEGNGAVYKFGSGTMRVTGESYFSGPTGVFGGGYRVDGSIIDSPITVRSGSQLRGDGIAGHVTVSDPDSAVLVDSSFPDHQGGDLEVGNLFLNSGNVLGLDFHGPHATGGNDRLIARNTVSLGNSRLAPVFRHAPREGDILTVIEKQSAGAVTGTFNGLPQNTLFTSNGIPVRISYVGGNGNDVTLTVTNLALGDAVGVVFSGNDNATVETEECLLMNVHVQSRRNTTLTITNALLRSLTPGIEVMIATAPYQPVPANGVMTNSTPFQFRSPDLYTCGIPALFELEVAVAGEGIFSLPFQIPGSTACDTLGGGTCEACFVVVGNVSTNALTTDRPLDFIGAPSVCYPAKACPQTNLLDQPSTHYVSYAFTNTTTNALCLSAKLSPQCYAALGAVAYLGQHDPSNPCVNYLGDSGAAGSSPFSFNVPGGSNFIINVVSRTTNTDCGRHTLEIFGLPCPPPRLQIARDAAPGKVRLEWSTAYPDWRLQQAGQTSGGFSNSPLSATILGGRYVQTNALLTTNEFYRLVK